MTIGYKGHLPAVDRTKGILVMKTKRFLVVSVMGAFGLAGVALGQARVDGTIPPQNPAGNMQQQQQPGLDASRLFGGTMIGVGDIINIRISEEPDVSGQYQVSDSGDVKIPLLEKPIHADGMSTFDFSSKLAQELKAQQILKDPYVTVFIERGMTQNVTVSGPVARPGIYPIEKPTRLLDVLSMSGGLAPNAGGTITITHAPDAKEGADGAPGATSENIDVATLLSGDNRVANVLVHAGDNINVGGAAVIYVVGAVTKPGAFAVQDPRKGLSVLKAIALVEGTTPTAKLGSAIIVRKSTNETGREEIPLDLNKIIKGKDKDPVLLADDVLFVPNSAFKSGAKRVGDALTLAAGYGLGLRIAP
jgi:polysaccharide export outer membrane protein